jgi:hypothetical protein
VASPGIRAPRILLRGRESTVPTEESTMRHALVTIQLMKQARNAAIAQAEAEERLERQAREMRRTEPAEPGRFPRVANLARRFRVLAARTT